MAIDRDGGEVVIGYDQAPGVVGGVECGADLQAPAGPRAGDEVDDDLVRDEWASTPVHGDEREQPVFDLVPLAVPGGK